MQLISEKLEAENDWLQERNKVTTVQYLWLHDLSIYCF